MGLSGVFFLTCQDFISGVSFSLSEVLVDGFALSITSGISGFLSRVAFLFLEYLELYLYYH